MIAGHIGTTVVHIGGLPAIYGQQLSLYGRKSPHIANSLPIWPAVDLYGWQSSYMANWPLYGCQLSLYGQQEMELLQNVTAGFLDLQTTVSYHHLATSLLELLTLHMIFSSDSVSQRRSSRSGNLTDWLTGCLADS